MFDPNILTVATGMQEHDAYGVEFVEGVRLIKVGGVVCVKGEA